MAIREGECIVVDADGTRYIERPETVVTPGEVEALRRWQDEGAESLAQLNAAGYAGSEYAGPGGLRRAVGAVLQSASNSREIAKRKVIRARELEGEVERLRVRVAELEAMLRRSDMVLEYIDDLEGFHLSLCALGELEDARRDIAALLGEGES